MYFYVLFVDPSNSEESASSLNGKTSPAKSMYCIICINLKDCVIWGWQFVVVLERVYTIIKGLYVHASGVCKHSHEEYISVQQSSIVVFR